jgi:hypothetical protein
MFKKIKNNLNLIKNMGWRYIAFRSKYEVLRKTGLLKKSFPVNVADKTFFTLEQWKNQGGKFFFNAKEQLIVPKEHAADLAKRFADYEAGKMLFFNSLEFNIGRNYDWVTNPDSGFKYDINKHWTDIPDLSKEAGDIKFVWEKSRFSFLYDIIRYDYHFEKDCAEIVFAEIISWIDNNPINQGPNYRCSQEISLRVLNWTFALYYYKNSPALTPQIFHKMQHAIYWQVHHVYHNINFSRIAVRNNHAITETLTLYLAGIIFPFVPNFTKWSAKGKKWFEEEIAYQVYPDGTFLQFSMNYHRVVVQLLTWGIRLAGLNNEKFKDVVYDRAQQSLKFLRVCMDDSTGQLPNYGANDGALFFKLNNSHYRDYRHQLNALANVLNIYAGIEAETEDNYWYGGLQKVKSLIDLSLPTYIFSNGGYYIIRDADTITFLRCGNHKDRPSQADNLHLDIWYKGRNFLIDGGSYKYNTDTETLKYFMGTQSHNTVMVNGRDQMLKGSRFIWFDWTQCINAEVTESNDTYIFTGTIAAFTYINKDITHTRTVIKTKGQPKWEIKDKLSGLPEGSTCTQLWHLFNNEVDHVNIQAKGINGKPLTATTSQSGHSSLYAQQQQVTQLEFTFNQAQISTTVNLIDK